MTGLALRHVHDDLEAVAVALARRVHRGARVWAVAGSMEAAEVATALARVLPVRLPTAEGAAPAPAGRPAAELVPATREVVAAGDVVVLAGGTADTELRDLARRTRAWGTWSLWLTTDGHRPPPGTVDHLLAAVDPRAAVRRAAQLASRTAQLLAQATPLIVAAELDDGAVCVTCADEGLLAEVAAVDAATGTVTARVEGRLAEIDTTLLGPVAPHELVLVHAGMALERLATPDPTAPDPVRSWT